MVAKKFWHPVVAAALGALLAVGGCSSSESGSGKGGGGSDAGTDSGGTGLGDLEDSVAGKACESNDDCGGTGARCITSFEVGGELGSLVGLGQEAPGGYCTATCTDDSQCGKGGICANNIDAFGVEGQCEKACTKDGDCREGYVCTSITEEFEDIDPEDLGDSGVSELLPEGGLPQESLSCKPEPEKASLRDNVAGKACTEDADCNGAGAECLESIGGLFGFGGIETPGGYCSGDCTEDADCGAGGVCVGGFSTLFAGSCLKQCETNEDCTREGHLCRTLGEMSICIPTDSLEDDVAGTACEADADCGEDGSCAESAAGSAETLEGGFCTLEGCLTDDECGAGGACQITVANGVPSSRCAEACDVDAQDCSRENFVCVTQDESSSALMGVELSPYCQLQAAEEPVACDPVCEAGQVCQDGTCVAE